MTTTLIDDHRAQIADLCRTFGVRQLDVFGSATRDDFDPARSDVDFLVDFGPDEHRNRFRDYFGLRDALARLLGRPVDDEGCTHHGGHGIRARLATAPDLGDHPA